MSRVEVIGNTTRAELSTGKWSRGVVEWIEGETAWLSVVFTWDVPEAFNRALWHRAEGRNVRAGGPAFFTPKMRDHMPSFVQFGGDAPGALQRHNPMACKAFDGCPAGCYFCIVPGMEGRTFTLRKDFVPRPVLTDNNLSALSAEQQQFIVDNYVAAGVPLLDANSGFEPKHFTVEVFERWLPINRGPWRFGADETGEMPDVERVIRLLRDRDVSSRKIQVYTMIGHEPFAECMARIQRVIDLGGEPYVQPILKLNQLTKQPWVRHDWTARKLKQVQRWVNAPAKIWRNVPFAEYDASIKSSDVHDDRAPLFDDREAA